MTKVEKKDSVEESGVLVTCGPLTAESPHSMTLQSVWESRERKGAASRDRDFNASEKPGGRGWKYRRI